jgi:protein-S-isoprenylcysteine O-methyltransferase Ste14
MKRFLIFLYGVVSYAIFFVTFLYAIGFVDGLLVPKSVDAGIQGGTSAAWLVDIVLLSLFAVQHSVMARQWFKRLLTRIVATSAERSTYVLFSSLALITVFWFWRPLQGTLWSVQGPAAASILLGVSLFGWVFVLTGSFLINHFNLFGLQQVYSALRNHELPPPHFVKPLFYKFVRHPLMLGFIIAFWAAPVMTVGHFLFAFASTGYILFGIQLEERDLVRFHGEEYRRYQREVSQIIPMPPRQGIGVEYEVGSRQ